MASHKIADVHALLVDYENLLTTQGEFFRHGHLSLWEAQQRAGYPEGPPADMDLDSLAAEWPGSGWGSMTMRLLSALADRHQVSVFTAAHATDQDDLEDGADHLQDRLIAFYAKHGFTVVHDQGAQTEMVRHPRQPEQSEQQWLDRALAGDDLEWQPPAAAHRP